MTNFGDERTSLFINVNAEGLFQMPGLHIIDIKSFALQMTQNDLDIYFNWSCNQLAGEPVATDAYLRQHLDVVKMVACNLLHDIGYYPKTVYRGVIMKDGELKELQPDKRFTYLSFSEDKSVAEIFADPEHDMGRKLKERGDKYGYITEYTPKIEEVLFHYSFLKIFPYVNSLLIFMNIDGSKLHVQKEVTILQPKTPLILKAYDKINPANI